jgi:PST family polysaccharide transporter
MTLFRRTLTGAGWQFGSVVIIVALQLVVIAILARHVLPEEFGLIAIAQTVVSVTAMFAQLGLAPALIQRKDLTENHIRVAFSLTLVTNALMVALLWILAPLVALFFRNAEAVPVLRAISFTFLFAGWGLVANSLLARGMQFRKLMISNVLAYFVGYAIVGISLAVAGYGVWALVGATLVQNLVATLVANTFSPHAKMPSFSSRELRDLLGFGGGLTLNQLFNNFALQADNLIVGRWLGADALGIYGRAYQIMILPVRYLGQSIDKVMFPAMAQIQDQPGRLVSAYLGATSMANILLLPASAMIIVLSPEIVAILLGPNWTAAVLPLQILTAGAGLRSSVRMADSLVRAVGAVYRNAARKAVFAFAVVAGSWSGLSWGLPGVAVGVTLAVAINFLLTVQLGLSLTHSNWRTLGGVLAPGFTLGVLALVASGSTAYSLRLVTGSPLVVAAGTVITTSGLLIATSVIFPGMLGSHGAWFMKRLFGMLPPSLSGRPMVVFLRRAWVGS